MTTEFTHNYSYLTDGINDGNGLGAGAQTVSEVNAAPLEVGPTHHRSPAYPPDLHKSSRNDDRRARESGQQEQRPPVKPPPQQPQTPLPWKEEQEQRAQQGQWNLKASQEEGWQEEVQQRWLTPSPPPPQSQPEPPSPPEAPLPERHRARSAENTLDSRYDRRHGRSPDRRHHHHSSPRKHSSPKRSPQQSGYRRSSPYRRSPPTVPLKDPDTSLPRDILRLPQINLQWWLRQGAGYDLKRASCSEASIPIREHSTFDSVPGPARSGRHPTKRATQLPWWPFPYGASLSRLDPFPRGFSRQHISPRSDTRLWFSLQNYNSLLRGRFPCEKWGRQNGYRRVESPVSNSYRTRSLGRDLSPIRGLPRWGGRGSRIPAEWLL